jgi:hypothetical protein
MLYVGDYQNAAKLQSEDLFPSQNQKRNFIKPLEIEFVNS